MTDTQRIQLGISDTEMFRLHRLWSQIAPNELTGWDYSMIEQSDVMGSSWFTSDDNDPRWSHSALIERDNQRVYGLRS